MELAMNMSGHLDFWGISSPVFGNALKLEDIFIPTSLLSGARRIEIFCKQNSSLLLMIAPAGHGKTTFAKWISATLPPQTHEVLNVCLTHSQNASGWLIPRLAMHFNTEVAEKCDQGAALVTFLEGLDELVKENRRLLIIVDGAECLENELAMDEINAILGLQHASQSCVNILLLGTPEFFHRVKNYGVIKNKMALVVRHKPLAEAEVNDYLNFIMKRVGLAADLITVDGRRAFFEHGKGIFSFTNSLIDNCLIEGYLTDYKLLDATLVEKAIKFIKIDDTEGAEEYEGSTPHRVEKDKKVIARPQNVTKPIPIIDTKKGENYTEAKDKDEDKKNNTLNLSSLFKK